MDGWTDGWISGGIDGWIYESEPLDGWMNRSIDGSIDGWIDCLNTRSLECPNAQILGCVDGSMKR
jgi:hypothetical protein